MCTGAEIIGLALSGGGLVMNQMSQNDAAEQQQKIINQAQQETERLNQKKSDTINNFAADTFNPATRDQRYEQAATKGESSLAEALLDANGGTEGEIKQGAEGNLSSDYVRGKATATSNATEDILKRAKLMARTNAGSQMYEDESLKGGQLASDVLGINAKGTRTNNAARAGLAATQDNGSLAAGLLMAAGGAAPNFKKAAIPGMTGNSNWGVTI